MSRQKIRDERREYPRERAQPVGPGKGGEGHRDDLGIESPAGGREEPDPVHADLPGTPPPEAPAQVIAERRDEAAREPQVETAAQTEEPLERSRQEAAAATARRWLEEGLVTSAQARAVGPLIGDGKPGAEVLEGLVEAGILTRSQAAAVSRAQRSNGHSPLTVAGPPPARVVPEAAAGRLGVRLPRFAPDARKLGVLLAAVAFVGLVWAVFSLLTDALATPRHPAGVALLDSMRLLTSVLTLVGGRRMYRGMQNGKVLVLTGLVIYALASVLLAARQLADPVVVVLLLSWAVLYYVTAVSRFGPAPASPGEPAPR
ncbi:MAG: hypothetical protein M3Z97_05930 [Candidatus Dormibacteraeota bacterium]|nr:hypothetical protein [Candidatus Dormibacteraeota bacterium]